MNAIVSCIVIAAHTLSRVGAIFYGTLAPSVARRYLIGMIEERFYKQRVMMWVVMS